MASPVLRLALLASFGLPTTAHAQGIDIQQLMNAAGVPGGSNVAVQAPGGAPGNVSVQGAGGSNVVVGAPGGVPGSSSVVVTGPGGAAVNVGAGSGVSVPGVSVLAPGAAIATAVPGITINETAQEVRLQAAGDVLFDFDQATIRPDAAAALQEMASVIRSRSRGVVHIEGYTDAKGTTPHNLDLSRRRALAVETWLVANAGFPKSGFAIQGFGAARPVAPNRRPDGSDDPEGRQKNRRVELVIAK